MGVRPEHVAFDDSSALRGTVFGIEYLGTTQVVTVSTAYGPVKARISSGVKAQIGEIVGLRFRTEALVLFDGATRRSIAATRGGGFHG